MNRAELMSALRSVDPLLGEFFRAYIVIGLPADTTDEGVILQKLEAEDVPEIEEQILAEASTILKRRQEESARRRAANGTAPG